MAQTQDREYLALAADAAKDRLPDDAGFILITSWGPEQRARYVSNIDRSTAIKLLKEFLFRNGEEEAWMKHIK